MKQVPPTERTVLFGVRLRKPDLLEVLTLARELSPDIKIGIDNCIIEANDDIDRLPFTVAWVIYISTFGTGESDEYIHVMLIKSECQVDVTITDRRARGVYVSICDLLRKRRVPVWWLRAGVFRLIPLFLFVCAVLWWLKTVTALFIVQMIGALLTVAVGLLWAWPDDHYVLDLRDRPPFWARHKDLTEKAVIAIISAVAGAVAKSFLDRY